ncbi:MAG: glycosyltransferase family 2 protein [Candidatus Omnitrophica bacterium]|nr:glycosyltransferase family 2 protein [Candidatus Omnitrophota bacterium]
MFNIFLIINTILILYFCLRSLVYIHSWKKLPIIDSFPEKTPLISVIVPARNEEKSIGNCLDSLVKQSYPNYEIIVVNDESTDRTREIVEEFVRKDKRVNLINSKSLPKRWLGKCWSIYQGVQIAKGDWLLFSDADVIHHPDTITSVYYYSVKNNIDFLTLKFNFLVKGFWEKIVIPALMFIKTWFVPSPRKVNDMDSKAIEAKGDFIFVNRKAYEEVGEHQAVKNEFIESAALMRRFKEYRKIVALLDGSHLIKVRKFHSLREIISSYSKFYYKFFESPLNILVVLLGILFVLGVISPFIIVLLYPFFDNRLINLLPWALIQILIIIFVGIIVYRKDRFFPLYIIGFPLGALVGIYIILSALFNHLILKKKSWRGRCYDN